MIKELLDRVRSYKLKDEVFYTILYIVTLLSIGMVIYGLR